MTKKDTTKQKQTLKKGTPKKNRLTNTNYDRWADNGGAVGAPIKQK